MSRISLQIRRSPLGGFSGISRYERRMLGGASRLTVENATLEVERINKAIDDRLSKGRRSVAEFRRKFAECFFKCLEVLRAGKRVLDEKRDDSAHDVTGREQNCTAVVDQVLQRRARIGLVLLVHSVSAPDGGGDGDSSAADPDDFDDVPFWPHERIAVDHAKAIRRYARSEKMKRLEAQFARLNASAAYDTVPQAPNQLHAQCVEISANKSAWVWALDLATPHTDSTTFAEYRGGNIVAFRRFSAEDAYFARG